VKDEKGDLVADSHSIVARWRNYFSQLFNMHEVKDVGQAEIHTAEPPVPEPNASEVELAINKLKSHKSPGTDQIPAEMIKAGGRTICLEIHKLVSAVMNLWVPLNAGSFLTSCKPVSFSRRTLHHGVSK